MDIHDSIVAGVFFLVLISLSVPFGRYMANVFSGRKTFLSLILGPVERALYRLCGIDPGSEMTWKTYAGSFIMLNLIGMSVLFLLQVVQGVFPLNPQGFSGVRWDTALNTAVSFATNTNWQAYGGESTMSYLTQMLGMTVQNFVSAGIGMTAGVAFIRGFIRRESDTIGNLWVDLTRAVLYVLLPLSIVVAIILISQGVVQTMSPYASARTLEGATQVIPLGPAASQIAIKQLGSNGGGFFGANSAHPFENPTMLSNLVECFSILFIPAAFVFMFGFMMNRPRQGVALFLVMAILCAAGLALMLYAETMPIHVLGGVGISEPVSMEGKEMRFGVLWSAIWSQLTTATSNGSVNSMHDSFMPLGGLVQLFNMGIGGVIFGGVGVGLIGMLFYVILAMFVAGLMIGRTPEFMGKKLGPFEMIMAMVAMLSPMVFLVVFSAIAVSTGSGLAGLNNPSSHGLSEILYAYSSALGNNGSAFAGLNVNTVFYNLTLAGGMLIGRFSTIIPALAVAGALAKKTIVPESSATFPTTGPMFVIILISVIFIMGALTFFPVYTLGPVLEHFFVGAGRLF
ncbi:MAG TPA: potassium-transporting ATPase subunit KdpA [Spirochaetota bacterium]|nr:potassium-transporting ATPase subunit KdpA [Spirochaetota bacterium]HNT11933.1 potassium-transporting ATPase subunit KdpA [Spirochaetota bacterium]